MGDVHFVAGGSAELCPGICLLDNPVQEYAWGSRDAIPNLLGKANTEGRPFAELWMGAHPKAPSRLMVEGKWENLDGRIRLFPEEILGARCCKEFSGRLPFLFKVIAAEKPLSIQVHPNVERAKKGFARENALGIPLDAPHRNYRDDNHKPELLCALAPFLALKGFREIREMVDLIGRVCPFSLSEAYERFKERGNRDGLKDFFSALLSTEERHRRSLVSEAVDLAKKLADKDLAFHWMMELNRHFPLDVGVLSPLILNLVELKPGEAIFLPDGELHAYLSGMGLEIMANSDNVLRGGLTPKYIDVPELLRNLTFHSGPVSILVPLLEGRGEERYSTPAKEFELSKISVAGRAPFVSRKNRSVEVLLCGEGEGTLTDVASGRTTSIRVGQSALVSAWIPQYRIEGNAVLYRATVPS